MLKKIVIASLSCFLISGCAYKAQPLSVAAYDVYSSYDDKISGKYLLYVDGVAFNKTIKPTGISCGAHSYPIEGSEAFKSATVKTLTNIIDQVEVVNAPATSAELKAHKAKGMIIVKAQDMISRLRIVDGLFSSTAEADIEFVVSVSVDGINGRLLGKTVSGTGRSESSAGGMCEGSADAVSQAATQAGKQALTKLAEELSNAERIRTQR